MSGASSKTRTNGYTLIELIVVITIISTILFIAVPRVVNVTISDNSKKLSRWLMGQVEALKAKSVSSQRNYILHIGLDTRKIWITSDNMSDEELGAAIEDSYSIPSGIKIIDVDFPHKETISTGEAKIHFYKQAFSDMALIHIEKTNQNRLTIQIEPFLTHARLHHEYLKVRG